MLIAMAMSVRLSVCRSVDLSVVALVGQLSHTRNRLQPCPPSTTCEYYDHKKTESRLDNGTKC